MEISELDYSMYMCVYMYVCVASEGGVLISGIVDLRFSMYNVPGTSGSVLIKGESDIFVSGVILYTSSWDLDV